MTQDGGEGKKEWSDDIDPSSIPDDVLKTERGRRNAAKRTRYTGGIYWRAHNPDTPRCRCRRCMARRKKQAKTGAEAP